MVLLLTAAQAYAAAPGRITGTVVDAADGESLPGAVVEPGAVVKYAILGENCRIGRNCRVGGTPDSAPGGKWNLTVLAPDCALEDGREIAPGVMLDHHGKEVLK